MFKHILLPTDGSDLSLRAIEQGVALAKLTGARVTGIHVIPPFHAFTYEIPLTELTQGQYQQVKEEQAAVLLGAIEREARAADVPFQTVTTTSGHPHEDILRIAREKDCDLIVMASHGRRGLKGLLLAGETQKVLTHSTIPVLVCR